MNKSQYMREIYLGGTQGVIPELPTSTGKALEDAAKAKLTPEAFAYVAGASSSESTVRNNRSALDDWQIVPSMLGDVDISQFNSETTLFGKIYPTPLVVCPIGVQSQLHPEADIATARAAAELRVPFTLSSAGSKSIEEVAEQVVFDSAGGSDAGPGSEAWFQLYWPSDDALTASLLSRAKRAGHRVLVLTLDTFGLGWRPRDLDKAYNPFLQGQGVAQLFSDPYFIETYCEGKDPKREDIAPDERLQASVAAVGLMNPGTSRGWKDLATLRRLWGPAPEYRIVLKGIQSVGDAQRALAARVGGVEEIPETLRSLPGVDLDLDPEMDIVDGIWISDHGGRQVDGAIGSLQALPTIASMCRSASKTVIFDSGVRTGADVVKALALGAHAVGIGRPWAYGLAIAGQDGVRAVLRALLADTELCAALSGCRSLKQVGRHMLVRRGALL